LNKRGFYVIHAIFSERSMVSKALLSAILADESLTRGLGDAEARVMVEWLVDEAEQTQGMCEEEAKRKVKQLCLRARALGRFVTLWCNRRDQAAASQLAATERFTWALPGPDADAYDLMIDVLTWEKDASSDRDE